MGSGGKQSLGGFCELGELQVVESRHALAAQTLTSEHSGEMILHEALYA